MYELSVYWTTFVTYYIWYASNKSYDVFNSCCQWYLAIIITIIFHEKGHLALKAFSITYINVECYIYDLCDAGHLLKYTL